MKFKNTFLHFSRIYSLSKEIRILFAYLIPNSLSNRERYERWTPRICAALVRLPPVDFRVFEIKVVRNESLASLSGDPTLNSMGA